MTLWFLKIVHTPGPNVIWLLKCFGYGLKIMTQDNQDGAKRCLT